MTKTKVSTKTKIILSSTLLLFVMLLSLIVTPLVAHAATVQASYASYNTKTGEVSYYDILPENSNSTYNVNNEESGRDSYYNPSEN